MATSAFKSTSKRGTTNVSSSTTNTASSTTKILRRSRSVCSIARTKPNQLTEHDSIPSEFSIKRDNPLFCDSSSSSFPSPPSESEAKSNGSKAPSATGTAAVGNGNGERGRSVSRQSVGAKTGIGRSVSRVRGRSVSRPPYGAYESEKEEMLLSTDCQKANKLKQHSNNEKSLYLSRNGSDIHARVKHSQLASSQGQAIESEDDSTCSLHISNWEDGVSNASLSEAEVKTTVHEQTKSAHADHWGSDTAVVGIYETVRTEVRRALFDIQNDLESAIRRNDVTISTTDVPAVPDFVNPGPVELVLDIRKEYVRKFEESEERARKLRVDLAVEEHRGQELGRILKEILPEPTASTSQRSRFRRRKSSERKNVSRRLTEEAMAYFDECVSISTFDSSDFSAPEDPPHSSVWSSKSIGNLGCSNLLNQNVVASPSRESILNDGQVFCGGGQVMHGHEDSGLTTNSSSGEPSLDQVGRTGHKTGSSSQFMFSAAETPTACTGPQNNFLQYAKHFERDAMNAENSRSGYDMDEYKLQSCLESFLFDKVFLKNRMESGSMHLCGGGLAVSFSPFSSAI